MGGVLFKLGALTSKVSAYRYRSWELEKKETLDFSDSFGQIGIACIKGLSIMRIIPYTFSYFDWISDKFRFSFDSLGYNRNSRCLYKKEELSMLEGFSLVSADLFSNNFQAIDVFLGKSLNLFDLYYLQSFSLLFKKAFFYFDSLINKSLTIIDERFFTYIDFSNMASFSTLYLMGVDLRLELPLLEAFLVKKLKFDALFSVGVINSNSFTNLGANIISVFSLIINGTFLGVKKMLSTSTIILNSAVALLSIFELSRFISNLGLILDDVVLKSKTIKQYLSDINVEEIGMLRKNIGGVPSSNSLVFLVDTSEIVVNKCNNMVVNFSSHKISSSNNIVDLSFPILLPQEINNITFTLQGGLVYCEKLLKNLSGGLSVAQYSKLFMYFIKYNLLNINTIVKLIKNKGNISLFILSSKYMLNVVNKLMINNYIFDLFSFKNKFYYNINTIYRSLIVNYYYTHNFLTNSPTILLADARLFNKNVNFR